MTWHIHAQAVVRAWPFLMIQRIFVMNFNHVSVGGKLWAIVVGQLVLMAALAFGMQSHMTGIQANAARVVQSSEDRGAMALRWKAMVGVTAECLLASSVTTDEPLAASLQAKVKDGVQASTEMQKKIEQALFSSDDKVFYAAIVAAREQVLQITAQLQAARANGDLQGAQRMVGERMEPAMARYLGAQDAFVQLQEQQRDRAKALGDQSLAKAQWLGLAIALAVMAAALLLSWLLVRSITRPLQRAVGLADAIADGDLTQDVHDERRDELGQLLRALSAMGAKLRSVVGEVRAGVASVSSAAHEIATGNHDLSARTEQTAANLEETAASMEELTATVTQSADTARQANQLAANAAQAAAQGGEVVGQVVTSMQQITDSSRKISDIIGVIDSIAFQTNILALNAAVEAARAGEQGRGFAVVASEVRNLAGRSAEAAKEIKGLITTSVQNVEAGSHQVEQAGRSMSEIVTSVRRVSDLIGEITASSTEQRDGIGQVNQAVANLDQMTQQNAALVEEASAAAAAMSEQAQRLSQVVSVFNVGAEGAALAPAAAPAFRPPAAPVRVVNSPRPTAAKAIARPAAATRPAAPKLAQIAAAPKAAPAGAAGSDDDWESF